MARPRIAVCLSGCGFLDGSEIQEAVLTMLALDRRGADLLCCAPDEPQTDVVDHLRGQPVPDESRNVLVEAARIARGDLVPLAQVRAADCDALVFPGGYGAAKNLCDFAFRGARANNLADVDRLVGECLAAGKPMGFVCIAPALMAIFGRDHGLHPRLTIGTDPGTAETLEAMGAVHEPHAVDEIAVDEELRVVSTPAYMLARSVSEAAAGIDRLGEQVLAWCS